MPFAKPAGLLDKGRDPRVVGSLFPPRPAGAFLICHRIFSVVVIRDDPAACGRGSSPLRRQRSLHRRAAVGFEHLHGTRRDARPGSGAKRRGAGSLRLTEVGGLGCSPEKRLFLTSRSIVHRQSLEIVRNKLATDSTGKPNASHEHPQISRSRASESFFQ
jgi:hypothetical protein